MKRAARRGAWMGIATTPGQEAIRDDAPEWEAAVLANARDNPAAFGPLYERYFPRVYAYCLRRVGRPEEAEDLASVVFTRALVGLGGYRGGSVAAWLFRIARNAAANHLRARRPQVSLDGADTALAATLAAADDQPLQRVVDAEERAQLARLIATLPAQQREILTLTVVGELSAREVGAVLGKSEGAIWTALHRATQQLRTAHRRLVEEGQ